MKIFLSYRDYLRNFDSTLRSLDMSDPTKLEISTHATWVNVHPVILTMIAALGSSIDPENITIDNVTATSGHYLSRMGLFKFIGKESPYNIEEHESTGRFIPITQIRTPREQTRFITDMIPLLHLDAAQSDSIKYMVGELVRNVLEHSSSKSGAFVAAQYYPNANIVRLGISDMGVGVWKSMGRSWPVKTDIDAIKLALMPGITGTTKKEGGTESNAGAGLFFVKSMAMVARDYFIIYSGKGLYKLTKRDKRTKGFPRLRANPNNDAHAETNEAPDFPGTVVGIDITLDQTVEFTTLLPIIRNAYTDALKDRKKIKYKKPRFED